MPPDPIEQEETALHEAIVRACEQLGELADTVQIFCTKYDGSTGATLSDTYGTGNWYARLGQVGGWLDNVAVEDIEGEEEGGE